MCVFREISLAECLRSEVRFADRGGGGMPQDAARVLFRQYVNMRQPVRIRPALLCGASEVNQMGAVTLTTQET
jgi:hypothetical protein